MILDALSEFFLSYKGNLKKGSRLLVACSGGPDSIALVHGLKVISKNFPYRFHLAHVNHGLRKWESAKDARFVREVAKKLKWPFHVQNEFIDARQSGNLEERARVKRYKALFQLAQKEKCLAILTAHCRDDQVETILMNLSRGTGPDGLCGMTPLRRIENVIYLGRPLLGVPKSELLRFLKESKIRYREDKSNQNQAFFRNWMRKTLIPLWESRCPRLKDRIVDMARILRDEQYHWSFVTQKALDAVSEPLKPEGRLLDQERLKEWAPSIQRRVLRQIPGSDLLTFGGVERLREWMGSPPSSGRQFLLKAGWIVERLSKTKGARSAKLFWFHESKN